ncbi:hypothetical protein EDC17_102221 [Sphingobacterium alimentarium]|uniref:Uncharacterized protein n=1 Tax=Sphingobacterium alimentarium TaxID=797292 RepID=A0A4R3VX56_9SPHI|nr:hypothetical protein EDC17_102221 [Sphingobacterium alimentarium]
MSLQSELNQQDILIDIKESAKGFNPFADFSCCALKKCCKKYKKGKRCKKCPDR